jgi:CubicO group peptidase (beta-lactamase class C family)
MASSLNLSGAVVALSDSAPIIESYGGLADATTGEPCAAATRFQLASVSKQFTATAILLLAEQGLLGLSDPIGRWINHCPSSWDSITLHHLLTHTSGLGHWCDHPGLDLFNRTDPDEEIAAFQAVAPLSAPGTGWRYSSPAFVLLAHVVQHSSGQPYATFLAERIFEPAGLLDTFAGNAQSHRVAQGHSRGEPVASFELDVMSMGAGDVWSTGRDLARWLSVLGSGEFLSDESRRTMFTRHALVGRTDEDAVVSDRASGYGCFIGTLQRHRIVYHPGDNPGFNALGAWFPDDGVALAILSNEETTDIRAALERGVSTIISSRQ